MRALLGSSPPVFRAAFGASLKKRELSCVHASRLLAGTSTIYLPLATTSLTSTSGLTPLFKRKTSFGVEV